MRYTVPMFLIPLLFACATRAPAPPAATSPEPASEAAIVTPTRLVLNPDELRWDEAAGVVTFSPDQTRMSAEYAHYVLDLASVMAALGGRPTEPVAVTVELGPPEVERYVPSDPNLPAPSGGFVHTTWRGKVTGRAD